MNPREELEKNAIDKLQKKTQKAIAKKNQVLKKLNIEYVNIDSIKPNQYNPNRQNEKEFDMLVKSMRENGFTQPVIVNEDTGEIVDGEHRWRAAKVLGFAEIPIVKANMTKEQMKIATLSHNRARGSEDVDLVALLMKDLNEIGAMDWAKDSLDLSDREVQKMLNEVDVTDLAKEVFSEEDHTSGLGTRAFADMKDEIDSAKSEEEKQSMIKDYKKNNMQIFITFSLDEIEKIKTKYAVKSMIEVGNAIKTIILKEIL